MRYLLLIALFSLALAARAQDERNYFVEAEISNPTPFVGQQVTYTFRLYSKVSRTAQGAIVDPDFEGFWQHEAGPILRYTAFVDNEPYDVTERHIALFPAYAGAITIEPAALLIPDNPSRPGEALFSDSLVVNVQELPAEALSISFDGAVGQFEMEPTVDRQEVRQGEPVTLHLTIRGDGNIEQLPAPELPESDTWRILRNPSVYQASVSEGLLIGQKTFEWLLTAVEPGPHPLPAITITYFEPSSQSYQSIGTTETVVKVLPAEGEEDAFAMIVPTATPLPLAALPASLVASRQGTNLWSLLLWTLPPLAALIAWIEVRRRWLRLRNAGVYQRSEALKHASKILEHARQSREPYRLIREALLTYFADKLNTTPRTLSYLDIERALRSRVGQEPVNAVFSCLDRLDQGLYAPGGNAQNPEMIQRATRLLETLDTHWEGV